MEFNPTDHQHTRFNPLTGNWILVSPHRLKRPWSGQVEHAERNTVPEHDPSNPLCPRSVRSNGVTNPDYSSTFVFTNDFPALLEGTPEPPASDDPLFQTGQANGTCRVMCFHPKSNRTLPVMSVADIRAVIDEWINQFRELADRYVWVQIFENKGAAMGCSNPHPHCQIWACSFMPTEPALKEAKLREYYAVHGRPLLDNYAAEEVRRRDRIVIEKVDWLVVVPYWAAWPFETLLISRNRNKRLDDLTAGQIESLAVTIKELTTKYDNLFRCSFPYSMGFHGAPTGPLAANDTSHWTLHASYYPPLLRSASVRKFMVGFELLCQTQRDLTAEQAAERLRQMDGKRHYSEDMPAREQSPEAISVDSLELVGDEIPADEPCVASADLVSDEDLLDLISKQTLEQVCEEEDDDDEDSFELIIEDIRYRHY